MKAIRTRYLSPTNFKGGRIKASDGDGNFITLSYDHSLDTAENHEKTAHTLCSKMDWTGELKGGWFRSEMYWVFV